MNVLELRQRIESTAEPITDEDETLASVIAYGYGACLGCLAALHATDTYAAALIDNLFPALSE